MNKENMVWGAHSGIQKAVRRGDLDLAFTCFELMWPEKEHRNWLKWRLPILVIEDAYYMIGELVEFTKELKSAKDKDAPMPWKRFLYKLVMARKNKDTHGLMNLAMRHPEVKNKEVKLARLFMADLTESIVNIKAAETYSYLIEKRELSEYEELAMRLCVTRAGMGGILSDRYSMLSTMVLIATRGLDQTRIEKQMQRDFEAHMERVEGRKPHAVPLPWYIFDMHTRVGMAAMTIFIKRFGEKMGITRSQLEDVWFYMASAYVPDFMKKTDAKKPDKPTCFEQVLWDRQVAIDCKFGKYNTFEKVQAAWPKMEKTLRSSIEWLLSRD